MIELTELSKHFTSTKKAPGFQNTIRHFFSPTKIEKKAVDRFSMAIKPGEIVGLLGPNGAGKTTLMKMMTGIIVPTSGQISVLGDHPWERKKSFRKKIALVMGQKSQLWWDIPAMDSFELLKRYYEIPSAQFKARVEQMSDLLRVEDLMHIQVRRLSLGERMKMELMASLLHSPEIVFLDEPTIGLDLVSQENIRKFILSWHRDYGTTIVLTSHYMIDIEALCSRLVLIQGGRKRFDGAMEEFSYILGKDKGVTFWFREAVHSDYFNQFQFEMSADFKKIELRIPEDKLRQTCIDILQNFPVSDFTTENLPIERVMKTLMENPQLDF